MFDLQEGDLKIAKVLWNIVIPMFLGAFILFGMGIEVPFGFFNIIVTAALYYAIKLCTDKEKSWLRLKLREYKVKNSDMKELAKRMDTIPVSIALAQAASGRAAAATRRGEGCG